MDKENINQQLTAAMVRLGPIKSEHMGKALDMARAARALDAEEFVKLGMSEWTQESRLQ